MIRIGRKKYNLIFYFSILFLLNPALILIGNDNDFTVSGQQSISNSKEAMKPAPEYCANTLDGKVSCLEDYKGKPILVNVWATWCIPCRQEMPALEALHKEYSSKGFDIIGVSVDSPGSENRIRTFVNRMGISYTILHDPDDQFASSFRTIGVPESYLINQAGQIAYTWKGPFDATSADTKARVQSLFSNNLASTETNVGSSRVDLQACKLEYSIVSPK